MKKLTRRAFSALIVAAAVLLGLTVYVVRFARHSGEWVSYSANQSIFKNGMLIAGTVTDRIGLELAGTDDGKRIFAGDALVRTACLHAVGDAEGNIGTGALRQFSGRLSGYNPVTGVSTGGGEVQLTIDAPLCAAAYQALAGRRGAVLLAELLCAKGYMD